MKTFWMWAVLVWCLLFSLCGVVWSIYNTRDIHKIKEEQSIVATYKGV